MQPRDRMTIGKTQVGKDLFLWEVVSLTDTVDPAYVGKLPEGYLTEDFVVVGNDGSASVGDVI